MANQLVWTGLRDAVLATLRRQGLSWDAVAASMGISRWAAIERAKLIGAHLPLPPRPPRPQPGACNREPLPAGHPVTWQALTAGTLLAGTAYPNPPLPPVEEDEEEPALDLAA